MKEYPEDKFTIDSESFLKRWHTLSSKHRHIILPKYHENLPFRLCGCFYCLSMFDATRIKEWIDNDQTAICPTCGIDSVIPYLDIIFTYDVDYNQFHTLLSRMQNYWFSYEDELEDLGEPDVS